MAAEHLRWQCLQRDLTVTQKAILMCLCDRAQGRGQEYPHCAWPSRADLADDTGANIATVQRALNHLEQVGCIERVGHVHRVTVWRICLERMPPSEQTQRATPMAETVPQPAPDPAPTTPAPQAPDPLAEVLAWTHGRRLGLNREDRHLLLVLCLADTAWSGDWRPLDVGGLIQHTGYPCRAIEIGLWSLVDRGLLEIRRDSREYRILKDLEVPGGR